MLSDGVTGYLGTVIQRHIVNCVDSMDIRQRGAVVSTQHREEEVIFRETGNTQRAEAAVALGQDNQAGKKCGTDEN